jgi:hypothetical protein
MILDGKHWQYLMSQSSDRVVVEIDVCDLDIRRQRLRIDREPMIV